MVHIIILLIVGRSNFWIQMCRENIFYAILMIIGLCTQYARHAIRKMAATAWDAIRNKGGGEN